MIYVTGLFSNSHMAYEADRDNANEPSLAELTEKAIQILSKNEKGFFLLVEGNRFDLLPFVYFPNSYNNMITLRQYEFSAKLTVTKSSSTSLCFDHNLVIMFITASRHCSMYMGTFFSGGRIDHAHHASNAYRSLTDTVVFAEAVEKAVTATSEADTLIVTSADHSHVFTIGGYPSRGNPILGQNFFLRVYRYILGLILFPYFLDMYKPRVCLRS